MTNIIFNHLNADTNLISRKNTEHIGWIDGFRDGEKLPLNHKHSALRVRFRDGITDVSPQDVVDAYNEQFISNPDYNKKVLAE